MQIDSGISQAVRDANRISMTKNFFGDGMVETTLVAEKSSFKPNTRGEYRPFLRSVTAFGRTKIGAQILIDQLKI